MTTQTVIDQLDYTSRVGNYMVVDVYAASFDAIVEAKTKLAAALEEIPALFGDEAVTRMHNQNFSKLDSVEAACLSILRDAERVSKAKNCLELMDIEHYADSKWSALWDAVNEAGINYEDPMF